MVYCTEARLALKSPAITSTDRLIFFNMKIYDLPLISIYYSVLKIIIFYTKIYWKINK